MVFSFQIGHWHFYRFDTELVVKVFANSTPNLSAIFSAFKKTVFIYFFLIFTIILNRYWWFDYVITTQRYITHKPFTNQYVRTFRKVKFLKYFT